MEEDGIGGEAETPPLPPAPLPSQQSLAAQARPRPRLKKLCEAKKEDVVLAEIKVKRMAFDEEKAKVDEVENGMAFDGDKGMMESMTEEREERQEHGGRSSSSSSSRITKITRISCSRRTHRRPLGRRQPPLN